MLIRAYGQFWNPNVVDWGCVGAGNRGDLIGRVTLDGTRYDVDFWDAMGIYVLIDNFKTVYAGKAVRTRLGPRLRTHLTDRFAGRWDMFSWFSQSTITKTTSSLRDPGQRLINPETVTKTLEALAILIADPPLNRKRESLPHAVEAEQIASPQPKAIRQYLDELAGQLEEINEKVQQRG